MPTIAGIHHASITVPDIEKSVPWYSEVLGLTKLMDEPHPHDDGYAVVLGTRTGASALGSTPTRPTRANASPRPAPASTTSGFWCPATPNSRPGKPA